MKVTVLKYNAGNIRSVLFALNRIGVTGKLSDDPEEIVKDDFVIFPGVGEALSAMNFLKPRGLDEALIERKKPTLGICLGLQLMCLHSEERNTSCLSIFPNRVILFPSNGLKVPHMGWNKVSSSEHTLFNRIENEYFYFVHSYHAEIGNRTIARTEYGISFSSALHHDNFYAVQFHPEKSGSSGEKLLRNFLAV
jgi:glutamine amidotransferase